MCRLKSEADTKIITLNTINGVSHLQSALEVIFFTVKLENEKGQEERTK